MKYIYALLYGILAYFSQKNTEKISIVMAVFNTEKYLKKAITSILNQSYKNFEFIIIDDASTDKSWEIIQSFANKDTRIRNIRLDTNCGTYHAKNIGMTMATGDFIAFCDSDDISLPQRLATYVYLYHKFKDIYFITHMYIRISNNFLPIKNGRLFKWSPSSIFFHKSALKAIGMLDDVRYGADSEFVARLKTVYGESSHYKIYFPLFLSFFRKESLSFSGGEERRQKRKKYELAWTRWHSSTPKENLFIPFPHKPRKFESLTKD